MPDRGDGPRERTPRRTFDPGVTVAGCLAQRTIAWNVTDPSAPGAMAPGRSYRSSRAPALFSPKVKTVPAGPWALPGTYSSRGRRLSVIDTARIGVLPMFRYLMVYVSVSPGSASSALTSLTTARPGLLGGTSTPVTSLGGQIITAWLAPWATPATTRLSALLIPSILTRCLKLPGRWMAVLRSAPWIN